MSQPIALGAVLGGRYKVVASLTRTPDGDHVLQGEDQILRRRVSILVPSAGHESLLVDNARSLAGGAGHSGFQVLDMGQTEDSTYLVTSYFPAEDLLEALLSRHENTDDDSLSDDIFGGSRTAASTSYIYEEPDPTQPQQVVAAPDSGTTAEQPSVTRWTAADYDDYDDAPAAPSVRNRLGMRRKVRPGSVRSTMFDRAASQAGAGGAAAAAGEIDPTYDGDNRYESYARTEGKPGRLEDRQQGSRASGRDVEDTPATDGDDAASRPDAHLTAAPGTGAGARSGRSGTHGSAAAGSAPAEAEVRDPGDTAPRGGVAEDVALIGGASAARAAASHGTGPADAHDPDPSPTRAAPGQAVSTASPAAEESPRNSEASSAAAAGAGAGAGTATHAASRPEAVTGPRAGTTPAEGPETDPATSPEPELGPEADEPGEQSDDRRHGPVRWLLLLLLVLALVAAIVLGFRGLGSLTSQFSQEGPAQQESGPGGQPGADPSAAPSTSATPEIASVTRVTSDPSFMSDTDATLNQATDSNPATYWLSYGFSNAQFGNLVQYVGLAAELEEPATVQEVTVQQANGTGGQFSVYVSDNPAVDGAEKVGSGSFTGPEIRVPLSDAARQKPHRYVLIVWDQLPQLTSPIGGYQYGLRIGELSVR